MMKDKKSCGQEACPAALPQDRVGLPVSGLAAVLCPVPPLGYVMAYLYFSPQFIRPFLMALLPTVPELPDGGPYAAQPLGIPVKVSPVYSPVYRTRADAAYVALVLDPACNLLR